MPHEEQREKNIRLVTEVALDCFLANGIEKTKVADIALRSGLTERSAFRYFETKADLVLAASLLYWKRILERIDRMSHTVADGSTTGLQDAENVLICYSQLYRLDPNGMRFTLDAELTLHAAGRLHEIKNQPPEPFETSSGPMAKAIRKAPGAVTYAVLGMMLGSLYAIIVGPTTLKVPQHAMTISDFHLIFTSSGSRSALP